MVKVQESCFLAVRRHPSQDLADRDGGRDVESSQDYGGVAGGGGGVQSRHAVTNPPPLLMLLLRLMRQPPLGPALPPLRATQVNPSFGELSIRAYTPIAKALNKQVWGTERSQNNTYTFTWYTTTLKKKMHTHSLHTSNNMKDGRDS